MAIVIGKYRKRSERERVERWKENFIQEKSFDFLPSTPFYGCNGSSILMCDWRLLWEETMQWSFPLSLSLSLSALYFPQVPHIYFLSPIFIIRWAFSNFSQWIPHLFYQKAFTIRRLCYRQHCMMRSNGLWEEFSMDRHEMLHAGWLSGWMRNCNK